MAKAIFFFLRHSVLPIVLFSTVCYLFLPLLQERDIGDEYGWKQVHGDVFRPPVYPVLFTSLVGCGHQLAVVAIGCIISELMGHLYTQ